MTTGPGKFTFDDTNKLQVSNAGGGGTSDVNLAEIAGAVPSLSNALPVELSDGTNPLGNSSNPINSTVGDGADVAQGTTSDVAWTSGSGTVIAILKKIASSGGGAVSIANGSDVAEGTTTDAAVVSDVAGTISGKLRGLVKIFADVWDAVNHRLKVDGSGVTQPVSGSVSVSNFPATQPVSGTVAVSGNVTAVQSTGTNLHVVVDSAPSTAVTSAGLSNLDVALSTRTKPADQQHAIIDSGTTTVTQATGTNLHVVVDSAPSTAVTGPLTDTQLRATPVPVSGTVSVNALPAGSAVIGHVITDANSVTNATLSAETSKVIGTVNISAGQSITANAGSNLNTSALALDATLTGGTTKAQQVDASGNIAPVGDTVGRAPFVKLTDGTDTAQVTQQGALQTDLAQSSLVIELLQNINRELKAMRMAFVEYAQQNTGGRMKESDFDPSNLDITSSEEVIVN